MAFAPPCQTVSKANSTPALRSKENPYGAPDNPKVQAANQLFSLVFRRMLEALSAGHHVLLENPLMSYLWLFDELLAIMGMAGMVLTRIDHCTCGAPYQKPQLWLSSNPEMEAAGAVCTHPNNAHTENISGGHKARRTARIRTTSARNSPAHSAGCTQADGDK